MSAKNFYFIFRAFSFILAIVVIGQNTAKGATYYTASTGDIEGPIWATTTNGTPGVLPALNNNDIIYIDDNITITSNFTAWGSKTLTIYLNSKIDITGGKWDLEQNSKIIFQTSSAKIVSSSGSNADKIRFGNGTAQWTSSDPDLTGPGTMDKNFNAGTSPLPIALSSFTAINNTSSIVLEWITLSELNFDVFEIERSVGGNDFIAIGNVQGHGNSSTTQHYRFEDLSPAIGKNYYRLKSVDFDGSFEYSNVIVIKFNASKSFSVYPNPSDGGPVSIVSNFERKPGDFIQVMDNLGRTQYQSTFSTSDGKIEFPAKLPAGTYVVRFISNDEVKTTHLVIN